MEDEEPPSKEPPLFNFSCLIICIFIPIFMFYPIKACLGLFCLYAMYVGYMDSKQREIKLTLKRQLKASKDPSTLE